MFQSKDIFALGEEEEWKQYPHCLIVLCRLSRVSEEHM